MSKTIDKTCRTVRELRRLIEDVPDSVAIRDEYGNKLHLSWDDDEETLVIRQCDDEGDDEDDGEHEEEEG